VDDGAARTGAAAASRSAARQKRVDDDCFDDCEPIGASFVHLHKAVIPAKAGIHLSTSRTAEEWVPASAGTTM
jgi:hypothetical protein